MSLAITEYPKYTVGPDPQEPSAFAGMLSAIPAGAVRGWQFGVEAVADIAPDDMPEWFQSQRESARQAVKRGTADAQTMGAAAQFVYQLSEVLSAAAVGGIAGTVATGTPIGGTAGAALAAGLVAGKESKERLLAQGASEDAAQQSALLSGATMAVGVALPPYMGLRLLTQAASGVGINVGLGGAERYGTAKILESHGHTEIAKHYEFLDGMSIGVDAALGAAFPLAARAGARFLPKPSQVDAAMTADTHVQAVRSGVTLPDSLPGIDETTLAMARAQEQLLVDGASVFDLVPPRVEGVPNEAAIANAAMVVRVGADVPEVRQIDADARAMARAADDMDTSVAVSREPDTPLTQRTEGQAPDPEAEFSASQARAAAESVPDLRVVGDDGEVRPVAEALQAADEIMVVADQDARILDVAVACALRGGVA